jgi:23S rRNA A2030 N6-methylase RlmJ
MQYNHADRIGNEGDVAKHAVLAGFVAKLMEQPYGQHFTYVESHTGRALYRLPKHGRWENGIGPFSRKLREVAITNAYSAGKPYDYSDLHSYWGTCFQNREDLAGSDYHGSSGIVFKMLRRAGIPFSFHLWDHDTAVCHSLLGFYENWPQVSVCRGDGYEGVRMIPNATLALIDPISIEGPERIRILETLRHLGTKEIPFICWTAIVEGEERDSETFCAAVESDFSNHRITWTPRPTTSTKGCQITVPKEERWASLAGHIVNQLRQLMGWNKQVP